MQVKFPSHSTFIKPDFNEWWIAQSLNHLFSLHILYWHHFSVINSNSTSYQVYSSQSGIQHPRHLNLQWPASQRRTTPGCTPWTPSWSPSSSWAPWASCSVRSAPVSSCTAPAPTAACRHAPPPPWRTTTSNCTMVSSTRSNWTNSAAALRREEVWEKNHKRRQNARDTAITWKPLTIFFISSSSL